jgi:flagellar biosynthesis/type III secretory pathway M-ring protein FliF/YscJ
MFTKEMFDFLIKVIASWQVIAVTVVLIIYFFLVSYVARLHRRHSGFSSLSRQKKENASQSAAEVLTASSDDEGLGLEE